MKTTKEGVEQINAWLESDQDYGTGVSLLTAYGKNPTLKRLLPGREARFKKKLQYELSKLAGKPFQLLEISIRKELKPSSLMSSVKPVDGGVNLDSLPPVIARIIKEQSAAYNKRSMLHTSLRELPDDNLGETLKKRIGLMAQIEVLSARLDELTIYRKAFEKNGTVPEAGEVFPGTGKPVPSESREELEKKLDNTRKSLNKDISLLTYQGYKKLDTPNPMPIGPKRKEVEKRIAEKSALIEKLNCQIDGLD